MGWAIIGRPYGTFLRGSFVGFLRRSLPAQFEPAAENDFRKGHDQENSADEGVQTEERGVNPIKAATPRQPVFQEEAPQNHEQARQICDAKMRQ